MGYLGGAYRVYAPAFIDNGITGEMLLCLNNPSHYATLGVRDNLHITRINAGVQRLRALVIHRKNMARGTATPAMGASAGRGSFGSAAAASATGSGSAAAASATCFGSAAALMDEEEPVGEEPMGMDM